MHICYTSCIGVDGYRSATHIAHERSASKGGGATSVLRDVLYFIQLLPPWGIVAYAKHKLSCAMKSNGCLLPCLSPCLPWPLCRKNANGILRNCLPRAPIPILHQLMQCTLLIFCKSSGWLTTIRTV